ncbi:uncharacterized protein LOC133531289 [Cydia pomonella]|uniref:uncharacterized protein LOC133531289 n=1 Tax=Cydia pomonella TaxID=82600 RepID=UPI002ADE2416|nr:uncharacterized protein LOC133531289 [Cydia pomonella]
MSYTKCVYYNCKNTSQEISMFRFPVHDQERLLLWIRNSGNIYLDSLTIDELSRRYICAAHFHPKNLHNGNLRSRLLGPAVPESFQNEAGVSGNLPSPEVLKVMTPKRFYARKRKISPIETRSSSPTSLNSVFEGPISTPTGRLSRRSEFLGPQRRLSRKCLFQEQQDDTPKTKRMKYTASSLIKENKALKAQIRRLRSKSKVSSGVLLIKPGDFRSETAKTLALMQTRKINEKKKWTKEEKNVCLSLFYKSSSNYMFMRRQGVVLAAPSTIRKWLSVYSVKKAF